MRLIVSNAQDSATVTATSELLPAAYMQDPSRARVWRSDGTGQQTITTKLAAGTLISGVAVCRHNLSGAATLQFEFLNAGETVHLSETAQAGKIIPAGIFRAGVDPWLATYRIPGTPQMSEYFLPAPGVIADEHRIHVNEPSVGDYIEVGRLIVGEAAHTEYGPAFPLKSPTAMACRDVEPVPVEPTDTATASVIAGSRCRSRR